MSQKGKLKPCPFCGHAGFAGKHKYYSKKNIVRCGSDGGDLCPLFPSTGTIEKEELPNAIKAWNRRVAFEPDSPVDKLVTALEDAVTNMGHDAVEGVGEWETGMHCGLEDRGITDRYEACRYGHDVALEKVQEWIIDGLTEALAAYRKAEKEK